MSVDFPAPGGPVMPITSDLASAPARAVRQFIFYLRISLDLAQKPGKASAIPRDSRFE